MNVGHARPSTRPRRRRPSSAYRSGTCELAIGRSLLVGFGYHDEVATPPRRLPRPRRPPERHRHRRRRGGAEVATADSGPDAGRSKLEQPVAARSVGDFPSYLRSCRRTVVVAPGGPAGWAARTVDIQVGPGRRVPDGHRRGREGGTKAPTGSRQLSEHFVQQSSTEAQHARGPHQRDGFKNNQNAPIVRTTADGRRCTVSVLGRGDEH